MSDRSHQRKEHAGSGQGTDSSAGHGRFTAPAVSPYAVTSAFRYNAPTISYASTSAVIPAIVGLWHARGRHHSQTRNQSEFFADDYSPRQHTTTLCAVKPQPAPHSTIERNAASTKDKARLVPAPIVLDVKVEGQPARALLDSGSLADFMSSRFADQVRLRRKALDKPLLVALAVSGSRSMSNYSTEARIEYKGINSI